MKQIYNFIIVVMSAVTLLGLTACFSDVDSPDNKDGMETVTVKFLISNNSISTNFENTRADNDIKGSEGHCRNIYLIAFKSDNSKYVFDLSELINNLDNKQQQVTVEIQKGLYNFYVLANLDRYISETVDKLTEYEIKNIISNTYNTEKILIEDNLPMGYGPTNVNIDINTKPISLDLIFLCTKFRYTILFDARKDCISYSFGDKRIQFLSNFNGDDNKEVRPYINYTSYSPMNSNYINLFRYTFVGNWEARISGFKGGNSTINWKSFNPDNYLTLYDGASSTLDEWNDLPNKAWQGYIYLAPQQLATLCFPYTIVGNDNKIGEQTVILDNYKPTGNGYGQMRDLIILVENLSSFETSSDTRTEIENSSDGFRVLEIQR